MVKNSMSDEQIRYLPNGQWVLEKSKKNMPFNPVKDISDDESKANLNWVKGMRNRESIPEQSKHQLQRGINKIMARTSTRKNAETGEHEILLHRVMSNKRYNERFKDGHVDYSDKTSSWTPDAKAVTHHLTEVLENYGDKSKAISSWVPISAIKSVPKQSFKPKLDGNHNKFSLEEIKDFSSENEVILHPHKAKIHVGEGAITNKKS